MDIETKQDLKQAITRFSNEIAAIRASLPAGLSKGYVSDYLQMCIILLRSVTALDEQ